MQTTRRPAWVLAAFAAPCVPLAALGLPLVVYLPEYYANELGLGLAAVGAIFTWVRLIDVGVDPLLGALMDSTRTRFGRFKTWLALGTLPLFVSGWFLFFAKPGVSSTYLLVWLAVAYLAFSICVLAQTAWGAQLSEDYNQRSRIYGWWQFANVTGVLTALVLAALPLLMHVAPTAARSFSVQSMGWLIMIATPATFGIGLMLAPEPPAPLARNTSNWSDYIGLFANAAVRRIVAVDLMFNLGLGVVAALFFFYFERVKHVSAGNTGLLLLVYFTSGLIFSPLWTALARGFEKHRAVALGAALTGLSQLALLMLPSSGALGPSILAVVFAGIPYSAASLLLRAMMADVSDDVRLTGGVDRTGLLYAILASTAKLGSALAVGLTFPILARAGFHAQANGADSSAALNVLTFLFIGLPAVLCMIAALILLSYRLGRQRHAAILAELALRDANG